MKAAILEHVNVTVSDPDKTAAMLCDLFGWHVRWQGDAIMGGRTIHVGTEDAYVAVYAPKGETSAADSSYGIRGGLNHIAVVVGNIAATENLVKAAGFTPVNHGDYEPGLRFYFRDHDNIEFEVVSYP